MASVHEKMGSVYDIDPSDDTGHTRISIVSSGRIDGREAYVESAELFRLLGDPTRLAILHALLDTDERCVHDLASDTGISENVISQALRLLRSADIVRTRRDGRRIQYRLADTHVRKLLQLSIAHVEHQDPVMQGSIKSRGGQHGG